MSNIVCRAFIICFLFGQMLESSAQDAILAGGADPTIVATHTDDHKATYHVFSTAPGIRICSSEDLKHWELDGRVFEKDVPVWAKEEVPKSRGIWAPDISFHDGLYYLYYSVSSFGSQRSVIGLVVNKTLDRTSDKYSWVDRGKVIESFPGRCDYNAIDPAPLCRYRWQLVLVFRVVLVGHQVNCPGSQDG